MPGDVEAVLGFKPELGVDKRLLQLLRQRVFTTESLIKEMVKNSYEAEAEALYITVHPTGDLEFRDVGRYAGMSPDDIKAFLLIGTPHKAQRRFTEHFKRPIAGEQGIGRLSFTQLYKLVEVETEKDGVRVRFRLTEDMIDQAFPAPVDMTGHFEVLEPTGENGTKITCMGLKEGAEAPDAKRIKQYISANFLYTLMNPRGPFSVYVNGEKVEAKKPRGTVIDVNEKVEGVVVKGDRLEDSAITGCIIVQEARSDHECGIQLSVRGSPIGRRRSLGELIGDRSVDEEIPPTRLWGWIEAPFLKYTMGRDNVDTNHISYLKFREKMLKVVEEVRKALRSREEQEISRLESAAVKEACDILSEALRGEVELKPCTGLVSAGAAGGTVTVLTSEPVRQPAAEAGGRGRARRPPSSPHRTHHVHPLSEEGLGRKMREKGSWSIEPHPLADPTLLAMTDYDYGIIRVNSAHPMYRRRVKNKRSLRTYLLWIAAYEITRMLADEVSRNRALARLLDKMENMTRSQITPI
ncbi:MAG: ATP-binding protein [Candidatus Bathyarchaeia archaeon]